MRSWKMKKESETGEKTEKKIDETGVPGVRVVDGEVEIDDDLLFFSQ